MRRTLLLGLGIVVLSCAGALAVEGRLDRDARTPYSHDRLGRDGRYYIDRVPVHGMRGRKYTRRFALRYNVRNDKARIMDEYGYTPHRLATNFAGKRTERWKYYGLGLEFVFDYEGNLIETHRFPPEGNHID